LTWCVSESRGLFRGKVLHVVLSISVATIFTVCAMAIFPLL
jgi:hypothetical protein